MLGRSQFQSAVSISAAVMMCASFAASSAFAAKIPARARASTAASRTIAQEDLSLESELDGEAIGNSSPSDSSPAPTEPSISASTGEDVEIRDIRYDSKKDGGTVVIATSSAATYRTREVPAQNQVVIEIANAKLPDRLKRPFNTKDFRQPIISVNAYQEAGSSTARVVLQFRQPRSVAVQQVGGKLSVVTSDGAAPTRSAKSDFVSPREDVSGDNSAAVDDSPTAKSQNRDRSREQTSADADTDEAIEAAEADRDETLHSDSPIAAAPRSQPTKGMFGKSSIEDRLSPVRFYGKPISIEVRDTPVRDVITLIAEQSGANIVMADDVNGNITIKLRQIPWDQALSIIMKTRSLGYIRQGGVLRVAPARALQTEAEEERRIMDAQDATQPLRVKVLPVSFANVATLATQIRSTLQAANAPLPATGANGQPVAAVAAIGRGRIEADARSSALVVTDTAVNIARIEQLVRALDTPPLQVMIEGKIVEAKEAVGRALGISWGYTGQDLGFAGGTLSHNALIGPTAATATAGTGATATAPTNGAGTTLNLRLGTIDFLGDLTAKLSLLESESVAKIISSPRVITMNAQSANITQSVKIPTITTTALAGGSSSQTGTQYLDIPTTLTVTPQITAGGEVLMSINFSRSFQSGAGGSTAPIESRSVQTNVMVKNGQTTVVGGVYQADESETEEGTPFLRNIPVLGWLFKQQSRSKSKNELLVFITPRILNADRILPKASTASAR